MKTREQIKSELDGANAAAKAAKAKAEEIQRELQKHDSEASQANVQAVAERLVRDLHAAFVEGRVRVDRAHSAVSGGGGVEHVYSLGLNDGTRFTIEKITYR